MKKIFVVLLFLGLMEFTEIKSNDFIVIQKIFSSMDRDPY